MIDWLEALVLGVVQGATEYLPVSSSGHLVLAQHLFGLTEPVLFFDIVLHLGTLAAVLWYFRTELRTVLAETRAGFAALARGRSWAAADAANPGFRLSFLIVVGTLPTGLIGLAFRSGFERLFASVRWVGVLLLVTGALLLLTRFVRTRRRGSGGMKAVDALIIGLMQGLAIAPGISRSGATISAALLLGLDRDTAVRYSFLLSIPSILGALLLKLGSAGGAAGPLGMTVGFAAAAVSGYLCLALLVRLVRKGQLFWFSPYCFAAGLFALIFLAP
jgi:undecaprenyl-diphosphatase